VRQASARASLTPTSFRVSGSELTGNLTVTPPNGYEVSLSVDSGYTSSLSIPANGNLSSTQVNVRLAATTAVNGATGYDGNITVSGGGALPKTIATASSTVSPATLTLTANPQNKTYGTQQTTPVEGSTAFSAVGLMNGQTLGTVTLNYADGALLPTDAVGSTSTITPSNAAGGTFTPANYTINYVAGTLTVVGPPSVSYTEWAATNGVTGGISGDSNNDGIQNGVAYFMGVTGQATNPGLDADNVVTWSVNPSYRGTFEVQTSSDLSTWTRANPQPTPADGNLIYPLPLNTPEAKRFVRLLVTPN